MKTIFLLTALSLLGCSSTGEVTIASHGSLSQKFFKSKRGEKRLSLKKLEEGLTRSAKLGVLQLELQVDVMLITNAYLLAKNLAEGKEYNDNKWKVLNRYKEQKDTLTKKTTCFRVTVKTHIGDMESVKFDKFIVLVKSKANKKYRKAKFDRLAIARIPSGKVVGSAITAIEKNEWSNEGIACSTKRLNPNSGIEVVIVPKQRKADKLQVSWNLKEEELNELP